CPALYYLGELLIISGELSKAKIVIEEAHKIATDEETNNDYFQIHTFRLLGKFYQYQGNNEKAEDFLSRSFKIAEDTENFIQKGLSALALGELYIREKYYLLAGNMFNRAISEFSLIKNNYFLSHTREIMRSYNLK
ncbi:MAG: tetratricopeptide repeat protein, partial [Candidatus Omnitrophica bacterium]|nr:tetratricopeptide repeat protein [Candidatus Omnitrophota bacterium]